MADLDVEIANVDPPVRPEALSSADFPKQRYLCGIPMSPLLLRDDAASTLLVKPGGQASLNNIAPSTTIASEAGRITKLDLEIICPEGVKIFSVESITEEVLLRQSEFAAIIADGGFDADLSPRSCSSENLAVLYLASNPPKNLNLQTLMNRFALTAFYILLNGWKWKESDNWLDDEDGCSWHGITCNESNLLTGITLHHHNLVGTFPEILTHVSSLQILNLAQNSISGSLPSSMHQLMSLTTLELSLNAFSRTVPTSFWRLSHLEIINLVHFGGIVNRIPTEIGMFSSLQHLLLSDTGASGSIPSEIGACQSVRLLDLSSNRFASPIPTELGSLSQLQSLFLSANSFGSNVMPREICSLLNSSGGKLLTLI